MATKDVATQVIDTRPDEATMDDIIHALYVMVKFERGEQEIRYGKGISHEEARQRMKSQFMW